MKKCTSKYHDPDSALVEESLFGRHKNTIDGLQSSCRVCLREAQRVWRERNNNYDKQKERNKEWQLKNPEKVRTTRRTFMKAYRAANKEKTNTLSKQWRDKHPEKSAQYNASRRCRLLQATPSWITEADQLNISNVYKLAHEMSVSTGIKHEVDHIIPLRGRKICGLHVASNLQILSKLDNTRKGNYFSL